MIVDVHAHYHPRAYNQALARFPGGTGGRFGGGVQPDTDDEAHINTRLQMMEQAGVRLQVLSPAAGQAPYTEGEVAAVEAARLVNDLAAQLVDRYPDKFKAFVSLPLPHIESSLRELRRSMDELGMIGVNLHISALNRSVAEDEFLPIYAEMNRRRGIIFYHPCGNGICSPMITDYGLNGAVGTSLEDAAIVLHLIAKKIPSQYPNITFIIPHLGGPIPMLLQRLDNQFSMQQRGLPEPPSVTARRFYYDTVGHGSHAPPSPAPGRPLAPTTCCRGVIFQCCSPTRPTHAPSPGYERRACLTRRWSRSWKARQQPCCPRVYEHAARGPASPTLPGGVASGTRPYDDSRGLRTGIRFEGAAMGRHTCAR